MLASPSVLKCKSTLIIPQVYVTVILLSVLVLSLGGCGTNSTDGIRVSHIGSSAEPGKISVFTRFTNTTKDRQVLPQFMKGVLRDSGGTFLADSSYGYRNITEFGKQSLLPNEAVELYFEFRIAEGQRPARIQIFDTSNIREREIISFKLETTLGARQAESDDGLKTPAVMDFSRNDNGFRISIALREKNGPGEIRLSLRDDRGNRYGAFRSYGDLRPSSARIPNGFLFVVPMDVRMPPQAPLVGLSIVEEYGGDFPRVTTELPVSNGQPVSVSEVSILDLNNMMPGVLTVGEWSQLRRSVELRLLRPPQVVGGRSLMLEFEVRNTDYSETQIGPLVRFGQYLDGTLMSPSYSIGSKDVQVFCGDKLSSGCRVPAQTTQPVTIRLNTPEAVGLGLVMMDVRTSAPGSFFADSKSEFIVPVR